MNSRILTTFLILLLSGTPFAEVFAQEGQGKQHRRGRGQHRFVDRDGDGIEDTFQHRYGRRRLCHLVDEQLPLMRRLLSLPEDASLRMVCRLEEIPTEIHEIIHALYDRTVPAPPYQSLAEDDKQLTVYYSWSDNGNILYRWYLLRQDDTVVRLDGRRLLPPPAGEESENAPFPSAVSWNAAEPTQEK
jgi:hypothetical protein